MAFAFHASDAIEGRTTARMENRLSDQTAIQTGILAIIELLERGDSAAAIRQARMLASAHPDEAEPQIALALCHRRAGDIGAAMKALERAVQKDPTHGRAWQDLGSAYNQMGRKADAARAFGRAVDANDALLVSWKALAEYERSVGNAQAAQLVEQEAAYLSSQPRQLVMVASLLNEGRGADAERLCRAFLQSAPDHPEANRLLARIAIELERFADADAILSTLHARNPGHTRIGIDYINFLSSQNRFQEAYDVARHLAASHSGDARIELLLAAQAMKLGKVEEAIAVYDERLQHSSRTASIHNFRALALNMAGDRDGAVAGFRRALKLRPAYGKAWWGLANLKTFRFHEDDIGAMQHALAGELAPTDRIEIEFALGKALEDQRRFDDSFAHYAAGNALMKQRLNFDPAVAEAQLERIREVFTRDFLQERQGWGEPDPAPIFILGLPRSGSTLIEQILAAHSEIDGTQELTFISSLSRRIADFAPVQNEAEYPDSALQIDAESARDLGRAYLEAVKPYRQSGRFFTDKLPDNFRHVGFIKLILPNAKIIDARRNPLACGFSCFKQLFERGADFSYDLGDIGRFYQAYDETMDHFARALPGEILTVSNEALVEDVEGEVRRMLDFVGVGFEDSCLKFFEQKRSVFTPSANQVRQPISASGVDHWRNFEPHLAPLKRALGL